MEEGLCRICHGGPRGLADALVQPCACRGTLANVHVRWGGRGRSVAAALCGRGSVMYLQLALGPDVVCRPRPP